MAGKIIAVAAASSDRSKYWYKIFKDIRAYGLAVYCVNPKAEQSETENIYNSFKRLPQKPDTLISVVRPELALPLVEEALSFGVKTIWFQPGSYEKTAADKAIKAGAEVHDSCFMAETGIW